MPYQKAVLDPEIEEERRMFYVGMTRAKKKLHLYAVEERFGKKMEPSRFLVELEEAPKRGNRGQKNGEIMQMKHIYFWKSPDQRTEVWMKQVEWKNTGRKEETVPVGISSVSRNDKKQDMRMIWRKRPIR